MPNNYVMNTYWIIYYHGSEKYYENKNLHYAYYINARDTVTLYQQPDIMSIPT